MEVRYLGETSPSGCKKGKIYVVISVEGEDNFKAYRIWDEQEKIIYIRQIRLKWWGAVSVM